MIQVVAFRGYVKCDRGIDSARTKAQADLRAEFRIAAARAGGGGRGAVGAAGGGRGAGAAGGAAGAPASGAPARRRRWRRSGGPAPGAANACGPATPAAGRGANPALDSLPEARRREYESRLAAINAKYPQATVQDFVNHIDYAVKLMGIDHVGISSDFDGGGGIEGYSCALEAVNVTKELVRRGYSEKQIGQIWSGNLLRVLEETEKVAKKIQSENK